MDEIIKLKTGTQIKLEWSFLVLEYLEEREGSLEALEKKIKLSQKGLENVSQIRLVNSFVYAVVQANYDDEVLTYKQTIRLIRQEDFERIFKFIVKNLERENKKKRQSNPNSGNRNRNRPNPKK